MQAEEELSLNDIENAKTEWLKARDNAINQAETLLSLGLHKQITNRLLEPWLWQTVIVTSTEWDNFFALRCDKNAQPEIQKIAIMMREAYKINEPEFLRNDQWHLPLIYEEGGDMKNLINKFGYEGIARISCGRCARISYLTHDGQRDPEADIILSENLLKNGHMSPFEHVAIPIDEKTYKHIIYKKQSSLWSGNHRGWVPYRATIKNEDIWKPIISNP